MFSTMKEVRQANHNLGHVWFRPDVMESHGTTIESDLIGGRWFITSDKTYNGGRAYTIRHVESNGNVHTERSTELCQFPYWSDAHEGAQRLARGLPPVPYYEDDSEDDDDAFDSVAFGRAHGWNV